MKVNLKKEIFLAVASILLIIILSEVGLRLFREEYPKFNDQSSEYYANPRGYYDFLYIDNDGDSVYGLNYMADKTKYRLPDFLNAENYSKIMLQPSLKNNILGIGDSFTFGSGVRYEDVYLIRLQHLLNNKTKGSSHRYKIKNAGILGADVYDVWEVFNSEMSKESYSLVTYGFVLNDFGMPGYEHYAHDLIDQDNGGYKFDPLRKKSAVYNFIMEVVDLNRISKKTEKAYLRAFDDSYQAEHGLELINKMANVAESEGSKFILIIFPVLWKLNKGYPFNEIHEKLKNFCIENDILVLDLLPYFSEYKTEELWAAPTDHHPNEIAHNISAKALHEFIEGMR